ncbi:hypothetical protein KSP39_PZI002510 [Platanthera zijinensis]|uniref:RRM domain-containing protein n=1 Tax=Platanthera zijinensis TaxID=2320716 RepID=A0AAP0BX43_9ASPA
MGDSLFAAEPRSLRMDRRSPEAARLRVAVSKKLLDFLGNYSDEVLAEYIVVLVCNGKHQTQARDDLQAFLGEESGTFVTWLWNYLFEELIAEATPDISDPEAKEITTNNNSVDMEYKNNMLPNHHSHSIGSPKTKNGSIELPPGHANSDHMKPTQGSEGLHPCPSNLYERSTEVNMEKLKVYDIALRKSSGSKTGNFSGPAKNITSSIKCLNEVASVGKQDLHYEPHNQKIRKINSSTIPSQHLPEPKTEQTAIGLHYVIAEEHQVRPLPTTSSGDSRMISTAADDLSHQTARLRGSVWDRLGRPREHDQSSIKEEQSHHRDFIDGGKLDNQGEESQKFRSTRVPRVASSTSSLNRQSHTVDRVDPDVISGDYISNKVEHASSLKRKIEVVELNSNDSTMGNYLEDKEQSQQQQQSLPIKQKSQQNMAKLTRVAVKSVSSDAKFDLINRIHTMSDSNATAVSQSQVNKDSVTPSMKNQVPVSTTLPANSKSHSRTDGGNANQKPRDDDIIAVKLRLKQIEMDMLKLRSKQVGQNTDGKQNMSSVIQSLSEEGIESRTVLVSNVHFAATKESLISHFGRCGTIAKVVMLTDAVTGLPKGAAYIVFASKESVDKAISLSGTSFFSRILKVIRKVEVPPDYLVPSQPALKQQQQQSPFYPQPYGKSPVQKPHASSHLQWRRDQRSSGENTLTASLNGLGSSNSVE